MKGRSHSSSPRACDRGAGFTLIELLLALAILAALAGTCWFTARRALVARDTYESVQERYRTVRLAMEHMARDFSMAYVSLNDNPVVTDRRTYFIGTHSGSGDTVRFTTFGHTPRTADAHESDQCAIQYWVGADPDNPDKLALLRRETRRLANLPFEKIPGETYVLAQDVVSLRLTYWDGRDKVWRDEWNTTAADGQPGRLPDHVKIQFTVNDEKGEPLPLVSQVSIPLQEPEIGSEVTTPGGTQ